MIGQSLAHFRITAKLGEGGMGQVYRAEDTKLGREVALKVLPEAVATDPERLARLTREARLLASLDHPHIAAIHSFESVDDTHFLVMQLVEGETLQQRLARGSIPIDEALAIALQVAEAVEAAHGNDIIHRDLKPANVMIDPIGSVKVLDFGLAKALETIDETPRDLSHSPTLTAQMTAAGTLLGTAAYMSPEQVRGQEADKRSDIWALGALLWEMLSGRRLFPGETTSDSLARILEREPDWQVLPADTPEGVLRLLHRCLAKDPRHRLHDMADVRIELEEAPVEVAQDRPAVEPLPRWRMALPWVAALLLAAIALWALLERAAPTAPRPVTHISMATGPLAIGFHPVSPILALSSDGKLLAYVAKGQTQDKGSIYLRHLGSPISEPVAGIDNAQAPFFSPDGQWLGFSADGTLQIVGVAGGTPRSLCAVEVMHGAVWGPSNTIYFSGADGIYRVSVDGGAPERLTTEDRNRGEWGHHNPFLLPGETKLLFTSTDSAGYPIEVALFFLDSGERRTLIEGAGNALYAASGHLLYAQGGSLMAVPFDPLRAEVLGSPVMVVPGVLMGFPLEPSLAHFALSRTGTLVYVAGPPVAGGSSLVVVDREGHGEYVGEVQRRLFGPRFSPDGTKLLVAAETWGVPMQLWLLDLERDTFTRLTFEQESWWPLWRRDGRSIVFTSSSPGEAANLFSMPADGSGPAERLTRSDLPQQASTWSPVGDTLIFHQSLDPETGWDILSLQIGTAQEPTPLLNSRFDELLPALSPDGAWLAYVSNESGRPEVYVRHYPDLRGRSQISNQGGTEPLWSANGRELLFREGTEMMRVSIPTGAHLAPGRPEMLFDGDYTPSPRYGRNFDVAPDGQSFALITERILAEEKDVGLSIALNWFSELERRVSSEGTQ